MERRFFGAYVCNGTGKFSSSFAAFFPAFGKNCLCTKSGAKFFQFCNFFVGIGDEFIYGNDGRNAEF